MLDTQRERLDAPDSGTPNARAEILESWRRSRLNGVDPSHVQLVEGEARLDSRIAKVAIPVLSSMADVMIGARTSLLLSAPDGTLLWRWDEDSKLRDRLNRSNVVTGTNWSEDVVGTNGLGTALETSRAVTVNGVEHFNEALHDFTCAGAPIRHPVTHRVTGVLSVTSLSGDASPLMAPTLLRLARDVEEELYGDGSLHERQMMRHFFAERRRTRSAVVVLSADFYMANAIATSIDLDHARLWQQIEESPGSVVGLVLPDGSRVTSCRSVHYAGGRIGAVVIADQHTDEPGKSSPGVTATDTSVRSWHRIVAQLRTAAGSVDRLLVAGEDGVGKRSALRAAVAGGERNYREIDCSSLDEIGHEPWLATARAAIEAVEDLVVFAHLDTLDDAACRAFAAILDEAPRHDHSDLRIAATMSTRQHSRDGVARLILDRFPPLIFEVPPLRRRPDDILARLVDQGIGVATLSRDAQAAVQKHPWPGNHRQLEEFRRWLTLQPRPQIGLDDLPRDWLTQMTRGNLTAMQCAESELISTSLREHGGNKAATATALGISRSSLYRKMREYRLR